MKPKEYAIDWNDNESGQAAVKELIDCTGILPWETHVIEKSAYDRLEACCEKLADIINEGKGMNGSGRWLRKANEILAEYRAMKGDK